MVLALDSFKKHLPTRYVFIGLFLVAMLEFVWVNSAIAIGVRLGSFDTTSLVYFHMTAMPIAFLPLIRTTDVKKPT